MLINAMKCAAKAAVIKCFFFFGKIIQTRNARGFFSIFMQESRREGFLTLLIFPIEKFYLPLGLNFEAKKHHEIFIFYWMFLLKSQVMLYKSLFSLSKSVKT